MARKLRLLLSFLLIAQSAVAGELPYRLEDKVAQEVAEFLYQEIRRGSYLYVLDASTQPGFVQFYATSGTITDFLNVPNIGTRTNVDLDLYTNGSSRLTIKNGGEVRFNRDGVVTTPILSWGSDTNLGIYRKGVDVLAIAAAGGNVFEAASSSASVFGTLSVSGDFSLKDTNNTAFGLLNNDGGSFFRISSVAGKDLLLRTPGFGNVIIGADEGGAVGVSSVTIRVTGVPALQLFNNLIHSFPGSSAVEAYRQANFTVTGGVEYSVPWDNEITDRASEFSTANSSFTAKVAGFYCADAQVYLDNTSSAQDYSISLYLNTTQIALDNQAPDNSTGISFDVSKCFAMAAGDSLAVHFISGDNNLIAGGRLLTYFTVVKVQ